MKTTAPPVTLYMLTRRRLPQTINVGGRDLSTNVAENIPQHEGLLRDKNILPERCFIDEQSNGRREGPVTVNNIFYNMAQPEIIDYLRREGYVRTLGLNSPDSVDMYVRREN